MSKDMMIKLGMSVAAVVIGNFVYGIVATKLFGGGAASGTSA